MLGGVCGGLGERVGIDPTLLRIAALSLTLLAGAGVFFYLAAWAVLPRAGERSIARRAMTDRRERRNALAILSAAFGLVLALQALGLQVFGTIAWPLVLGVSGVIVIWRGSAADERAYLRELIERAPFVGIGVPKGRRATVVRVGTGIALIVAGLSGLATVTGPSGVAARGFLGAVAVFAGFSIVFGPWWLRLLRELTEERRERVRAEERAEMAAHIHDSVLQTLVLIQKSVTSPSEVNRLARAQERDLRRWLFEGQRPGSLNGNPSTLTLALSVIEREVEEAHGIRVESVVVGDCALDDSVLALLAAGREATVNAAKWSGDPTVSLFVEVDADAVSMFVHDRGKGFDPEAVPSDRNGIAQSIRARMTRAGGLAAIRSEIGVGTEVQLVLPRRPALR
jgi:signal transduction histidine kinase